MQEQTIKNERKQMRIIKMKILIILLVTFAIIGTIMKLLFNMNPLPLIGSAAVLYFYFLNQIKQKAKAIADTQNPQN